MVPYVSWKLYYRSTQPLFRDKGIHLDEFSVRPRSRQAESIARSEL